VHGRQCGGRLAHGVSLQNHEKIFFGVCFRLTF